jgi:hypothetical protein
VANELIEEAVENDWSHIVFEGLTPSELHSCFTPPLSGDYRCVYCSG